MKTEVKTWTMNKDCNWSLRTDHSVNNPLTVVKQRKESSEVEFQTHLTSLCQVNPPEKTTYQTNYNNLLFQPRKQCIVFLYSFSTLSDSFSTGWFMATLGAVLHGLTDLLNLFWPARSAQARVKGSWCYCSVTASKDLLS